MPKDLLEEKRKKQANQPRDLLAEKRALQDSREQPIPIYEGTELGPRMLDSNQPEQLPNNMSPQEFALYERFVKQFPRLAETIGGIELPGFIKKGGEYAGRVNEAVENTGLPSFAGGLLQGAGNTAISVANLPLGLAGKRIPHLDLQQFNNPENSISFGAGNIGGQIAGGLGATGLLGKLGQALNLSRPAGWAGLASDVAVPAFAGYATGEDAEGGGRLLPALIGGAAGGVNALRSSKIAQNIVKAQQAANAEGSQMYTKIFDEAGAENLIGKAPKIKVDVIKKAVPKKSIESLDRALADPSVQNLHTAQSDLGKWMKKAKPNIERGVAPSSTIKAYDEAALAQKKLRGSIFEALNKRASDQSLAKAYEGATINWAKNVAPYKATKALEKFNSGKISPDKLVDELSKDYSFMQSFGKQHPEIAIKEQIKSLKTPAKYIGGGAASLFGLNELKKILKGEK